MQVKPNEILMMPRKFEGDKSKTFWFIEDFETGIKANAWNEATALRFFPNYLDGSARHWFISICLELHPFPNWKNVKESFLRYYVGENLENLKELFYRLQQRE